MRLVGRAWRLSGLLAQLGNLAAQLLNQEIEVGVADAVRTAYAPDLDLPFGAEFLDRLLEGHVVDPLEPFVEAGVVRPTKPGKLEQKP
jgi:hypothetical protein